MLLCSYTAIASWMIITRSKIILARPNFRHFWLVHLNLLFPSLSTLFSPIHQLYHFDIYDSTNITRIDTIQFNDGSCKIVFDLKNGIHVLQSAHFMDHFASFTHIRNALDRMDLRPSISSSSTTQNDIENSIPNDSHVRLDDGSKTD